MYQDEYQDEPDEQIEELCAQLRTLEVLYAELCIDLNQRQPPNHSFLPSKQPTKQPKSRATEQTDDYLLTALHLLSWPEDSVLIENPIEQTKPGKQNLDE